MRNYTAGERALIVMGIMAGKTCAEINIQLTKDQQQSKATLRTLPESSYKMMKKSYFPALGISKYPSWGSKVYSYMENPKPISKT